MFLIWSVLNNNAVVPVQLHVGAPRVVRARAYTGASPADAAQHHEQTAEGAGTARAAASRARRHRGARQRTE